MSSAGYGFNNALGTKVTSTSGSVIGMTLSANTRKGDLVICYAYVSGGVDCTLVSDVLGDGWKILAAGYASGSGVGAFIAGILALVDGAGAYAGLTLPGNAAFTSNTVTINQVPGGQGITATSARGFGWHLGGGCGNDSSNWSFVATSGTGETLPARTGWSYAQGHEIGFLGATNNGAGGVETTGFVNGHAKYGGGASDFGQNSPAHSCAGHYNLGTPQVSAPLVGHLQTANITDQARTGTWSAAVTNRVGLRAFVPIVMNANAGAMRQRFMDARRFG